MFPAGAVANDGYDSSDAEFEDSAGVSHTSVGRLSGKCLRQRSHGKRASNGTMISHSVASGVSITLHYFFVVQSTSGIPRAHARTSVSDEKTGFPFTI